MINLLIKMADSLDKRGLHSEASKVDVIIKKIADALEQDFHNNLVTNQEGDGGEEDILKIYEDMMNKRKKKGKRG